MPILPHEVADFKARIARALSGGTLTDWQRQFLTDMADRLARYGADTRLSPKQEAILRKLITLAPAQNASSAPSESSRGAVSFADAEPYRSSPARSFPAQWQQPRSKRPYTPRSQRPYTLRPRSIRRAYRDAKFGVALVVLLIGGLGSLVGGRDQSQPRTTVPAATPEGLSARSFSVTDGDTIKLHGEARGTRLVGFNTPETFKPRCSAERELGTRATERLKDLLASASQIELEPVACACRPGTHGTDQCNFGRSCAILKVDGRDVGDILVSEGLAVSFVCGRTDCPPTPRPCCG